MSPSKEVAAEFAHSLTEEQEMILETAQKFAEDVLLEGAEARDASPDFARAAFDALGELGFPGLTVAEERGGAGMGQVAAVLALEALSTSGASTAMSLAAHLELGARILDRAMAAGGGAGFQATLEALASGQKIATCAGLAGEFVLDGARVTGRSLPAINANVADVFILRVLDGTTPGLYCLDASAGGRPGGLAVEALDAPLGLRNAGLGRVIVEGLEVDDSMLVATASEATRITDLALASMRLAAAACLVGLGDSACRRALRYSQERVAFGKPLAGQQAVALKLGRMTEGVVAAQKLVMSAAHACDEGRAFLRLAALAKSIAGEAAVRCADEAIQIHGGYGFVTEYDVERLYRDAKTCAVLHGDEDACRLEVATALLAN